jgi:hypothetical protein
MLKPRQFIPVLILVAGLWAYHNSFRAPLIFDDAFSITRNPHIRHLWPIWDALSPASKSFVGGRPIVNLSLALNYALGGLAVRGYHVFNLAIHLLAGLTLYGIVRRTLLRPGLSERFGASAEWIALAVALLWTVHPLQTEAVTYISQRCESLMGLFYLLTLYWFICGVEGASERESVELGTCGGTATAGNDRDLPPAGGIPPGGGTSTPLPLRGLRASARTAQDDTRCYNSSSDKNRRAFC